MTINFDKALGVHQQALFVRQQRTEVLATNIANADTPGYKAKEIDFRSVLNNASLQNTSIARTHSGHINTSSQTSAYEQYRVSEQPSLDGNSVDIQQEKAAVADNAVRYQATITFLSRRFSGMISAFKGE
ncbi:MAG: flagellar basal body rod protein FlgB [Gammaproteobacteria bacterium]|nr:flagellar basal body rod protein FlgB [Gammaproteobacteria bacterium]